MHGKLDQGKFDTIKRYFVAYDGDLEKTVSQATTHIITDGAWDQVCDLRAQACHADVFVRRLSRTTSNRSRTWSWCARSGRWTASSSGGCSTRARTS